MAQQDQPTPPAGDAEVTDAEVTDVGRSGERSGGRSGLLLAAFAALMLVPVTLPVPVLRGLVQERFAVSELLTSLFMSINMLGAVLTAPIAGALADRFGNRRAIIVGALFVDGLCFYGLALDLPFGAFLGIRFVEGCAHITALSLLLSIAADLGRTLGRGRIMGMVGAGITLGVAIGAPLGGALGRDDPLLPVRVGAVLVTGLAVAAALALPDVEGHVHRPRLGEILRLTRTNQALWAPLAYAFTDRFTVGFFTTTFTLFMGRVHHLPPERIGMLLGLFLGPFFLLSYPFGRLSERVSRVWMMGGGSLLYGIGLLTLGLWRVDTLPFLMVALGVLSAVMFVPSLILVMDLAPGTARATALGGFNAAGSLGFICGPLVGGWVSERVAAQSTWLQGYTAAFAVAGVSEILCVVATLPLLRRLVRERRTT
jgi:MFS family permease